MAIDRQTKGTVYGQLPTVFSIAEFSLNVDQQLAINSRPFLNIRPRAEVEAALSSHPGHRRLLPTRAPLHAYVTFARVTRAVYITPRCHHASLITLSRSDLLPVPRLLVRPANEAEAPASNGADRLAVTS